MCLFIDFYFVAAEETMKSGLLPKILAYAGAITIKRTWREAGKSIKRPVDQADTEKIKIALANGWVVNFPQGTTKAFAEGRKGTAHIIKNYKPIVVPITIDGFRRAFDKKGLFIKKKNTALQMQVHQPLKIDYVKVSHHGSKANTNDELLSLLDCNNFIISANGRHHGLPLSLIHI